MHAELMTKRVLAKYPGLKACSCGLRLYGSKFRKGTSSLLELRFRDMLGLNASRQLRIEAFMHQS